MPKGTNFLYRGANAQVIWQDPIEYLIMKGDEKKNEPDIYFRNWATYFSVEGIPAGITFVSMFPKPEILTNENFQPIN